MIYSGKAVGTVGMQVGHSGVDVATGCASVAVGEDGVDCSQIVWDRRCVGGGGGGAVEDM